METDIERTPCKNEVRDRGDISISEGMSKVASKSPEARRDAWNRSSLIVPR